MVSRFALALSLSGLLGTAAHADVKISDEPTKNMTCSGGVCSPTKAKAILNTTELADMLATSDVTVAVTSYGRIIDIEVDAPLSWTSAHRLTLDSYHSIAFNKPVTVAGTGALTITTNDAHTDGDFRFLKQGHIEFWDERSSLIINGHGYRLFKK